MTRTFNLLLLCSSLLAFSCNSSTTKSETKTDSTTTVKAKEAEVPAAAEKPGTTDVTANNINGAAQEYCGCLNKAFADINPEVKSIIIKAGESENAMTALQDAMMNIKDEKEKMAIAMEMQKLSAIDNDPQIKTCVENVMKKYKFKDDDKEAQTALMNALKNNEDCTLVHALMQIGLQGQNQQNNSPQ